MQDPDAHGRGAAPEGHVPAGSFFRTNHGIVTISLTTTLSLVPSAKANRA